MIERRRGPQASLLRWLTVHQRPHFCINDNLISFIPPNINSVIERKTLFCRRALPVHLCTTTFSFVSVSRARLEEGPQLDNHVARSGLRVNEGKGSENRPYKKGSLASYSQAI